MAKPATRRKIEDGLAIRAAWLHYAAGMTQAEVAARLGVSTVKAHRLVSWANQSGAVKVSIDGAVSECVVLEEQIAARFGLAYCEVVPELYENGMPLRALGAAGAGFLRREIERLPHGVIGIGNGRTLAAAVEALPRLAAGGTRFVSLLGGLTRNNAANPHDVMHRLAEKTAATAYVMPVPFFANTVADLDVLLSQRGVGDVVELAAHSDLMVIGIGTAEPDAMLVSTNMIRVEEIRDVQRAGGVGEMLGHFFDRDGRPLVTELSARTISPRLDRLRDRRVVAIAGGEAKVAAIRAVLQSGYLGGLVTDERAALALMNDRPT